MTISDEYFALLDHLGQTRPVRDLLEDDPDMVVLRHDVDHDLDLALEMAFWEHRRGYRASYFLLPSASYWQDELLDEKVLQLTDYGHEVGLHLNGLAEWADGRVDDVQGRLRSGLATLRTAGVEVIGTAAHGDKSCYTHGVINNWVFSDLRPANPASEDGLSAEGVPSPDPAFRIPYPGDTITREDGATFALWSIPMADLGLAYEAVRLPMDGYYSDSGGSWSRSPDPMTVDLSTGRHQVLIHPEYYRGPQRFVFVLSTARSGSKWMANALARATNASVSHEHTLNHVLDEEGNEVTDHRTGAGFTGLLEDRVEVRRRIAQVRAVREDAGGDHIECNVYLPHCLDELREVYPEAALIHLHRDPMDVLRSLLNRQWYDTEYDDRHPSIAVEGWPGLTPVARCCAYINAINLDLLMAHADRLSLDQCNQEPSHLIGVLTAAGVAVHARLLKPALRVSVDATKDDWIGELDVWPAGDRQLAIRDLSHLRRALGYHGRPAVAPWPASTSQPHPRHQRPLFDGPPRSVSTTGGTLETKHEDARFITDGNRHAHLMLGGGAWHKTIAPYGWEVRIGEVVVVEAQVALSRPHPVTLFGLTYNEHGKLLSARRLAPLRDGPLTTAFRPRPDGAVFNLAVHVPRGDDSEGLVIHLSKIAAVIESSIADFASPAPPAQT